MRSALKATALLALVIWPGCRHEAIPDHGADPIQTARGLTRAGKAAAAMKSFEEILNLDADNLAAHRGLVEAAYFAGKLGQIAERYQRMSRGEDRAGLGFYGLGLIEVARGPGHMEAALRFLTEAAARMPAEADVPYRVGLIHTMNGEFELARESIQGALRLDPQRADVRVAYAHALVHLGRQTEAMEAMADILGLSPSPEVAQKARIISSQVFDPLRGLSTELAQDLQKAMDYLQQDSVQQALSAVEKIIAQNPEAAFAQVLLGLCHSRLENDGEAIVALEHALKLRPDSPEALLALGDIYARLERWRQAREYYEKAVSLDPFNLEAHLRIGELATVRRDHQWAARCFANAVLLDAQTPTHYHRLGLALVSAGNLEEAVSAYQRLLQIRPDDLEALVRLGSLHLALADREPAARAEQRRRARRYLQRAAELNPDNRAVAEMLSQLKD